MTLSLSSYALVALVGSLISLTLCKLKKGGHSLLSHASFSWVSPLIQLGFAQTLESTHLFPLFLSDRTENVVSLFAKVWTAETRKQKPSLFRALNIAFGPSFYALGILKLINAGLGFVGPLVLDGLVSFANDPAAAPERGFLLVGVLLASSIISTLAGTQYGFLLSRVCLRVRTAMISTVFAKCLTIGSSARDKFDTGEIVNLQSVDTSRVENLFPSINEFWALPLQIGVALYLLFRRVGVPSLAGLAVILVLIPINRYISKRIGSLSTSLMAEKDQRVKLINEALSSIRFVKLYGWEDALASHIALVRTRELAFLASRKYLDAWCVYFWVVTPIFMSLATFAWYVISGHDLDAATVFTVLSLFNILVQPVNSFPWVINGLIEAAVSLRRVDRFIRSPDKTDFHTVLEAVGEGPPPPPHSSLFKGVYQADDERTPLLLPKPMPSAEYGSTTEVLDHDKSLPDGLDYRLEGSFAWIKRESEEEEEEEEDDDGCKPMLHGLNLEIRHGEFVALVGSVGSGKSAILAALLGEMEATDSSASLRRSADGRMSVAYISQEPWIQTGTVRDNVLFGSAMDEAHYGLALEVCGLRADLEGLPAGDLTEVGERAINLSGGQKQRLALARAIYQNKAVYLMDDCLSSIDALVGVNVFRHALLTALCGKTRVLATHHHLNLLKHTDRIMVLKEGRVVESGTYEELSSRGGGEFMALLQASCLSSEPQGEGEEEKRPVVSVEEDGKLRQKDVEGRAVSESEDVSDDGYYSVEETLSEEFHTPRSFASSRMSMARAPRPSSGHSIASVPEESNEAEEVGKEEGHAHEGEMPSPVREGQEERSEAGDDEHRALLGRVTQDEDRAKGAVEGAVWRRYVSAVGVAATAVIFTSIVLMQLSRNLTDWWLSYWVAHSSKPHPQHPATSLVHLMSHAGSIEKAAVAYTWSTSVHISSLLPSTGSTRFYLSVFAAIALLNSIFTLFRAFSFAYGCIIAAKHLHQSLLTSVLRAPMSFFEANPIGRIINRFSADQWIVDDSLPFISNILLANVFTLVGTFAVICYGTPLFIGALLPLAGLYYLIQRKYRQSSREVRRMEGVTRSPLFSFMTETLSGVWTVRAFGATDRFLQEHRQRLDTFQRANFTGVAVGTWLGFRLQCLGVATSTCVALFAVLQHHFVAPIPPELIGLSFAYALSVTGALNGLVTSFTDTEKDMVAVERLLSYTRVHAEAPPILPHARPPPHWPCRGVIEVEDLTLIYRPGLPPALDDVSFRIEAGERIGIVGRTGSGKTTLLSCLFRLVELSSGRIRIDGLDISSIGLHDLRTALAIIPQDPVVFSGTVRHNLDPEGLYSDSRLYEALRVAGLSGPNVTHGGMRLDTELAQSGGGVSLGERQLLCVARAILRDSRVMVLDEATSAMDPITDALIGRILKEELRDRTLLIVAHRVHTVMGCSRVLVLKAGKLVEFDSPQALLQRQDSYFSALAHASSDLL